MLKVKLKIRLLQIVVSSLLGLVSVWCIYYVIFGLIMASLRLCTDFSDACMFSYSSGLECLEFNKSDTYQGFLFITSLFLMITSLVKFT